MDNKETALFWLNQGVASIPLHFKSKVPAIKWTPYKTKLPTEKIIDLWYEEPRNIALICGWSNLCVLDFDTPESYACFMCWHLEHNREILDTFRVSSNRGVHLYYFLSEPVKLNSLRGALFEAKTNGRLVTTPPSTHKSGHIYSSLDDPSNIKVVTPEQILNYSPITLHPPIISPTRSKYAPVIDTSRESSIEAIKAGVSILNFIPTAKQVDGEKRYYRGDCPFHGHKNNFWIDKKLNMAGCYAYCTGDKALSVIDIFMLLNNCDLRSAMIELENYL